MRTFFLLILFFVVNQSFSAQLDPVLRSRLKQSSFLSKSLDHTNVFLSVLGKGSTMEAEALGARIQTRAGQFFTARIPEDRLYDFAQSSGIISLKMGLKAHPMMDRTREFISENGVYQKGLTGSGVIVGVIDDSLDVTHPDFQSTNGLSRIAFFWDQTALQGNHPMGFTYGAEYSKEDIDAGRFSNTLVSYHGTHVTGIAAGNGYASGGVYRGIAPEAAIIFVKTDFMFASVFDGVQYIIKKSAELGMPCVINLSLGVHDGAHAADDLFNQAMDQLLEQNGSAGHIIVWAAGNEGGWAMHATNRTKTNASVGFEVNYTKGPLYVDFWYTNDLNLPIEVRENSNTILSAMSTNEKVGGNLQITRSVAGNERCIRVTFSSAFSATYQIDFGASLPVFVDGYLVNADENSDSVVDNTFTFFTEGGTLSTFCAQTKSISVGAMVTRTAYTNQNGVATVDSSKHIGEICDFSSMGPTRDGQYKPDVVAPGAFVISAKGHDTLLDYSYGTRIINSNYLVEEGTSMSAPVVSGLIALMLQKEPYLTVDEVRQKLKAGSVATTYKSDPGTWDSSYGFGVVNASFLLVTQPDQPSFKVQVVNNVIRLGQAQDNRAVIQMNMNNVTASESVGVKIYSQDGLLIRDFGERVLNSVEVVEYEWNGTDKFGRPVKPGIYQVSVEGSSFNRSFLRILVVR